MIILSFSNSMEMFLVCMFCGGISSLVNYMSGFVLGKYWLVVSLYLGFNIPTIIRLQ